MLTTAYLRIRWTRPDRLPVLPPLDLTPDIADHRVLQAVRDGITGTPGVTGCDLVSAGDARSAGQPYFVVSLDSRPLPDPVMESLRLGVAELHEGSVQLRLAWAQDGGIKVALVDVTLEIL